MTANSPPIFYRLSSAPDPTSRDSDCTHWPRSVGPLVQDAHMPVPRTCVCLGQPQTTRQRRDTELHSDQARTSIAGGLVRCRAIAGEGVGVEGIIAVPIVHMPHNSVRRLAAAHAPSRVVLQPNCEPASSSEPFHPVGDLMTLDKKRHCAVLSCAGIALDWRLIPLIPVLFANERYANRPSSLL